MAERLTDKFTRDLAPFVPPEEGLEAHAAFLARLRREHPRKAGFWSLQPDATL